MANWKRTSGLGLWIVLLIQGFTPQNVGAQMMEQKKPTVFWTFIGNTTRNGIGLYKLDTNAGTLTEAGIAAPANQPGFLSIAPNQKFLYSCVVVGNHSGVEGYSIDAKTGKLTSINAEDAHGEEACYVTVDPGNKNVLAANYNAHTVVVLPIGADGKLSPASCVITEEGSSKDPQRQTHAYSHSINVDPAGKFAISCDLGADKLFIYRFDAEKGLLTPNDPASVSMPPGSGPRHLTFHPNGKFVYAVAEMGGDVHAYAYTADKGALNEIQSVHLLKPDFQGNSTSAEVQIHPSGKFLYASNRIDTNYLTIFSIDQETGKLTMVGYQDSLGRIPRNFRIDPTGKFMIVANQGDTQGGNNLVLFKIDGNTGKLTAVGQPMNFAAPICVKFLPVEGG